MEAGRGPETELSFPSSPWRRRGAVRRELWVLRKILSFQGVWWFHSPRPNEGRREGLCWGPVLGEWHVHLGHDELECPWETQRMKPKRHFYVHTWHSEFDVGSHWRLYCWWRRVVSANARCRGNWRGEMRSGFLPQGWPRLWMQEQMIGQWLENNAMWEDCFDYFYVRRDCHVYGGRTSRVGVR